MQRRRDGSLQTQEGIVLIASYLAIAVLLILQTAYLDRTVTDRRLTNRYLDRLQALHMGEAGVDVALNQLRDLAVYTGAPTTPLGVGAYEVAVAATGQADTDEPMTKTEKRITSTGTYPKGDATTRTVINVMTQQAHPFTYALFAGDHIDVTGDLITSCYDSRDPAAPPCLWARVGTNRVGPDSIQVTGMTITRGADMFCGPGCNTAPDTDINLIGQELIGQRRALAEPKVLQPANVPDGLPDEGDLIVPPGQTQTLSAGAHLFRSVLVSPHATLTADGPVRVFVQGSVIVTQGTIRAFDWHPASFLLYAQDTVSPPLAILNEATVIGACYIIYDSASANVTLTQTTIHGSVVTRNHVVVSGRLVMQYDAALAEQPVGAAPREFQATSTAWANDR